MNSAATTYGVAKADDFEAAIHALMADTEPPTPPASFEQIGKTQSAITVSWTPSSDNVGVTGYVLYRGAELVATTTAVSHTHEELECGTSEAFSVQAFDAAGNRSAPATLTARTAACDPGDTTAPTTPVPIVASVSDTTIALLWSPSHDAVGVAGYNVYRDRTKVAGTVLTSHLLSGLDCGTAYTFAVDAYDKAGNLSAPGEVSASTASCPTTRQPTCDKVAAPEGSDSAAGTVGAPYRTPQKLADELIGGQTGCLRAGTYSGSDEYVLEVDKSAIRIRSYPGERATLFGNVHIRNSGAGAELSHLDIEGNGTGNTVKIYAKDVTVENNDITNAWRGRSCMILGSNTGAGRATGIIVRHNVFHECGSTANGNQDHAIYAQNVLEGEIVRNLFWNISGYAIQLYPNAQHTRFAHNVVDGGSPSLRGGVVFGGDGIHASSHNVVEQNVIAFATTYNITSTWSGSTPGIGNIARNNCVWGANLANINTAKGGFAALDNLVADPLFVGRVVRDYRIGTASLCHLLLALGDGGGS
jgi:hypothetical protein